MTSQSFSLLFLVSWFFTPPELKFDVFGTSKHGEEKSLSNCFSLFLSVSLWRFYRANYKSLSYTLYQFRPSSALWPLASALVSRSSGLGSSAVGARFVVFLDKTLNYHSASQWIPANVIMVFRRVSMHGCLRRFVRKEPRF